MWHKQSFTQFWSQSDAYSRRSSLKLTYIHHPLVVCTHQICCAVAVPIALSQDRLLHGHNRLVNWTPCSRMREQANKTKQSEMNDVNKWKHYPSYWPFVWGIHRSTVNSPHKGQWRGALMFPWICAWINGGVNNRQAGHLRRHRAHHDVTIMLSA